MFASSALLISFGFFLISLIKVAILLTYIPTSMFWFTMIIRITEFQRSYRQHKKYLRRKVIIEYTAIVQYELRNAYRNYERLIFVFDIIARNRFPYYPTK